MSALICLGLAIAAGMCAALALWGGLPRPPRMAPTARGQPPLARSGAPHHPPPRTVGLLMARAAPAKPSRYLTLERLRRQVGEARARGVPERTGLIGLTIEDLDFLLTLAGERLFPAYPRERA